MERTSIERKGALVKSVSDLNRHFEIPGLAKVVAGDGGLPKVAISAPGATGEIYLHGAHVTSWTPAHASEVLFLSTKSRFEEGIAIRGGIPVCFPWFDKKRDDPKAPSHGFARTRPWQLHSVERDGDSVRVTMLLESDDSTKHYWPVDFHAEYGVTFGAQLKIEFTVANRGTAPAHFEAALHTYFRIGEIAEARVRGLDKIRYTDKTDGRREKTQEGDVIITSETDREYLDTPHQVDLLDSSMQRKIHIANENSRTTVVWNPWIKKAQALSDFGDDEWKRMICVETSNVSQFAAEAPPGREHEMVAVVTVARL